MAQRCPTLTRLFAQHRLSGGINVDRSLNYIRPLAVLPLEKPYLSYFENLTERKLRTISLQQHYFVVLKRVPRDKDSLAEGAEFEQPVPASKLSDDSILL